MMPIAAMRLRNPTAFAYSTWNPLDKGAGVTLSGGNLIASAGSTDSVRGTRFWVAGKHYFEVTVSGSNALWGIGVGTALAGLTTYPGFDPNAWAYYYNGQKASNNAFTAYGAAYTFGDVIGVGFDQTTGNVEFFKNGVSQGLIAAPVITGSYVFPIFGSAGAAVCVGTINVGATPFAFGLPSGYLAWT